MPIKKVTNTNTLYLISICVVTLLTAMAHAGGLPGIGKIVIEDLGLNATQLGLLLAANHLGIMLFSSYAGYQSDRQPAIFLFVLGIILEFLAIIGFAVSTKFCFLLLFRFLDGIGFSFVNVAGTSELLRRYPKALRAFALGVKGTIFPGTIMLGAVIIPIMTSQFGWRIAFFLASAGPVLALIMVSTLFWNTPKIVPRTNNRSISPYKAMKIPQVWLLGFIGTICMLVQNGVISFIPVFFQKGIGISLSHAIQYLSIMILSGIIGRLIIGYLSCKILGVRKWLLIIIFSTSVCLCLITQFSSDIAAWRILTLLIILGVCLFGWYGSYVALMNSLSTDESIGSFAGIATQFAALGAILGPSITGIFVDYCGYRTAFKLLAMILFAMGLTLFAPGLRKTTVIRLAANQ